MFRNMQNAEIIRKMTEEFDEVTVRFVISFSPLFYLVPNRFNTVSVESFKNFISVLYSF